MKSKERFVLKTIGDNHIVVPLGAQAVDFRCMITLNATGAFLWEKLSEEQTAQTLTKALLDEYDVDEATAQRDVDAFLKNLRENALLEECV